MRSGNRAVERAIPQRTLRRLDELAIVPHDAQRRHRRHRRDNALIGSVFVHDDIAGKQEPDLELRVQRTIRQRRIAGTQDDVLAKRPIELPAQGFLHVDGSQHAEPFGLEGFACARDRRFVGYRQSDPEAV